MNEVEPDQYELDDNFDEVYHQLTQGVSPQVLELATKMVNELNLNQ